ncbi:hypothetical protein, partial [Paenibacillus koleovorans]|uniref:hypothetical protein n=1 Tax=Paenibacillus koleovorans TaxID=121608 RepID=UPI001C3FC791
KVANLFTNKGRMVRILATVGIPNLDSIASCPPDALTECHDQGPSEIFPHVFSYPIKQYFTDRSQCGMIAPLIYENDHSRK